MRKTTGGDMTLKLDKPVCQRWMEGKLGKRIKRGLEEDESGEGGSFV